MENLYDLVQEVESRVEEIISSFDKVKPEELDLDNRSAWRLYVNHDYIACRNSDRRTLDYYGGFEYVDSSYVLVLGNYTFYSRYDERVDGHIDTYTYGKEEAA
jgi:hypothetical protein